MPDRLGHDVDLTNCDREPIHLLGMVQPFGFLLAVSSIEWKIERVSQNVSEWLGARPPDLLGRPLNIFSTATMQTIRGHLQSAVMGDTTARMFGIELSNGLICNVAVHLVEDSVVIECEPTIEEPSLNPTASVRGMMARLRQADDDRSFYRVAAREMSALTQFDRVVVYRFDEDGSGEVIAEAARAGLESYLGLHYPASDIPKQARVLYERNWVRIIPDIDATPSPIEPSIDGQGRPLDLSMSVLRSVSSIHIEYLRNMGVRASMSVSILREGRLWGLFACHHYSPHHVGFGRRTAAELFGQMFSLLAENRERKADSSYDARAQELHQRLITVMASEGKQLESIVGHLDDIADLLACDGVGLWMSNAAVLKGHTPTEGQFARLVRHLEDREIVEIHARQEIGAEFPEAREFAERAAGMLVVPLSRPARDYLVFFRQEAARDVNWAGDPSKPVSVGPRGARLTPRKSFELWKENVKGRSLPWKPVECRIAESLRVSLLEVILRLTDFTVEERRRGQERQELLIAELNHRVRNILSLIRGVITQSKDAAYTVDMFTSVVDGRIRALARAHDQITADHWGPASFRALINAETGAYLGGEAQRVVFLGPDALIVPEAFTTIALVFHEMITNSAKYGALSDSRGRIEISTGFDQSGQYRIGWSEHGGPPVRPSTRRGFGSTVIERAIVHDLKGEVHMEFALAGLRASFTMPAAFARASGDAVPTGIEPLGDARSAPAELPDDVLLVEDNMIIALDAEEMLRQLGVNSVRVASGVAQALRLIDQQSPPFALLDVNLGSETCFEIADKLAQLGLPFAFASGYGEQSAFPERFANVKRILKPYSAASLRDMLAGAGMA